MLIDDDMKGTYCLGLYCIMDAIRDGYIMETYCLEFSCIMDANRWRHEGNLLFRTWLYYGCY